MSRGASMTYSPGSIAARLAADQISRKGGTIPAEMDDPEQIVERYRSLIGQLEIATHDTHKAEVQQAARGLRDRWREWQGEESLHSMAFDEPEE